MAKAKVTDVTGRQREDQIKAVAEQQAARVNEMSMATAVKEVKDATEVVDMTSINAAYKVITKNLEQSQEIKTPRV